MRGLYINSINQIVEPIELPVIPAMFEERIKTQLGCNSYTVSISNSKLYLVIVDKDCLAKPETLAFSFPWMDIPFFGNAILLGHNARTADAMSLDTQINCWTLQLKFFSKTDSEVYRKIAQQLVGKAQKSN